MSDRTVNGLTRDDFIWMLDDLSADDADYTRVLAWFDGLLGRVARDGELIDALLSERAARSDYRVATNARLRQEYADRIARALDAYDAQQAAGEEGAPNNSH